MREFQHGKLISLERRVSTGVTRAVTIRGRLLIQTPTFLNTASQAEIIPRRKLSLLPLPHSPPSLLLFLTPTPSSPFFKPTHWFQISARCCFIRYPKFQATRLFSSLRHSLGLTKSSTYTSATSEFTVLMAVTNS